MKVLVVAGYYDLATPFNGIEVTVSHLRQALKLRPDFPEAQRELNALLGQ